MGTMKTLRIPAVGSEYAPPLELDSPDLDAGVSVMRWLEIEFERRFLKSPVHDCESFLCLLRDIRKNTFRIID